MLWLLWLNVVNVYVNLCIIVYYFIYCGALLHKHYKKAYFTKRRPMFTLITHMMLLFWTIFLNNGAYMNEIVLSESRYKKAHNVWHLFETGFVLLTLGFGATVHMCRVWLLYFDMQLSRSLQNKTWQMAIDPNIVSNNWFLDSKNQRNFGRNGKKLLFYGFLIDIFVIAIHFLIKKIIEINFGVSYIFYSSFI